MRMNRRRWRDELEMLEAMYPDEFQLSSTGVVLSLGSVEIHVSQPSTGYVANVVVKGGGGEEKELVRNIAEENKGEECLVEMVQAVMSLQERCKESNSPMIETTRSTCIVLRIDHMNDRKTYLRRIEKWMKDLDIYGDVLFRIDGRRAKNIVCVLHGEKNSVHAFLRLLRTQKLSNLDVREKQSKVLFQQDSQQQQESLPPRHHHHHHHHELRFHSYSSWSELEDLYKKHFTKKDGPSFSDLFKLEER
jgi:hypothetical protein